MIAHFHHVGRVLFDGLRSVLLLTPRMGAFEAGLPVCVTLVVLNICAVAAFEFAVTGGDGWFNPQGVVIFIANSVGALALYLCAVPFARAGATPARIFTGLMALALIIGCAAIAVAVVTRILSLETSDALPGLPVAGWALLLLIGVIATFRLGFGLAQRARVFVGLGLVLVGLAAAFTFPNAPIFLGQETKPLPFSLLQTVVDFVRAPQQDAADDDEPQRPLIDAEATMTRQPQLLSAALAGLLPPRADRAEYYFLGLAPFASQDVFKREITAVKAIFDERFDTAGRSLALINHRDTISVQPLASMTNLDAALGHLGRLMRADRDVLVLFVTSHGNKGQIAVSFPGFPLNGLTPDRLAVALDRAGIVNRVLVLSACHAGSFVERLRGDHTLILAAAHADKTSFGCGNENEWTYFGDAYFNRALRVETSLIPAFEVARELIVSWEKREKLEPSEPQISLGSAIKAKLDAVDAGRLGMLAK